MVAPDMRPRAQHLLVTCASLRNRGEDLHDGDVVQFGGPRFVVSWQGQGWTVSEPDYGAADPIAQTRPDVTFSLRTLERQLEFVQTVGTSALECGWAQGITYAKVFDWNGDICLQRGAPDDGPPDASTHSGWFVKSADPDEPEPADYYNGPVYSLLDRRPVAMLPLLLPVGTLAVIQGDQVVGVADEDNVELWCPDPTTPAP